MTRLYLIRHGNTADEETKKVYKGRLDIPLSPMGVTVMGRAAAFLASSGMARVFTSTLSRSVKKRGDRRGRPGPRYRKGPFLRRGGFRSVGRLELLRNKGEVPEDLGRWIEDPGTYPPPQGESFAEARERSMPRLRKVIAENAGKTIGVVAHAGIIRIMLSRSSIFASRGFSDWVRTTAASTLSTFTKTGNVSLNLLNFTRY